MPARDLLRGQGTVREVLKPGAYRVELANGHRCTAHTESDSPAEWSSLEPGALVELEFHPYDLSKARVMGRVNGCA